MQTSPALLLIPLLSLLPMFATVKAAPGDLDPSFGGSGIVTTRIGTVSDIGTSMALQTDGKIVVAGRSLSSVNNYDFAVIRLNVDGTLDESFGGGKVITPIAPTPPRLVGSSRVRRGSECGVASQW